MAEAAKENKEVKKVIDELDQMSLSPEERRRYEDRERAIMRYNSEVAAHYEHGEEAGEKKRIRKRQKRRKASCGQEIKRNESFSRTNNASNRIIKRRNRKIIILQKE